MEYDKVIYAYDIPVEVDESMVYTRLSYKKAKTIIEPEITEEICSACDLALRLVKPMGAYSFVNFKVDEAGIFIDGFKINSNMLKNKLSDSTACVITAVTLGENIDDEIAKLFAENKYTKAVILDAASSCIADRALENLKKNLNKEFARENLELGKFRVSPGQLDIPLSLQKTFYNKLCLGNLGIKITETMMLTPQKTVISISGVKHRDGSFVSSKVWE